MIQVVIFAKTTMYAINAEMAIISQVQLFVNFVLYLVSNAKVHQYVKHVQWASY